MRKIFDKLVTGFFIIVLGSLWYCTKCFVKPSEYKIIIYDNGMIKGLRKKLYNSYDSYTI